jgi:hypothetical protein
MKFPTSMPASGGLFEVDSAHSSSYETPLLRYEVQRSPKRGWHFLVLRTSESLLDRSEPRGDYAYHFLLRRSKGRFLLLAEHAALVEVLLVKADLWKLVHRPTVDVQSLVTQLVHSPGRYALSKVYCRVDRYGKALRTVVLFGSDLANAQLFKSLLPELVPYRGTLRDIRLRADVLAIGSRGDVSFHFHGGDTLAGVDAAMKFLSEGKLLNWEASDDLSD